MDHISRSANANSYTNSCISAFERILRAWCSSLLQVRIEVAGRSTLFGGSSMTHERTLGGWRLGRSAMLLRRSYSDDLRCQTSPKRTVRRARQRALLSSVLDPRAGALSSWRPKHAARLWGNPAHTGVTVHVRCVCEHLVLVSAKAHTHTWARRSKEDSNSSTNSSN